MNFHKFKVSHFVKMVQNKNKFVKFVADFSIALFGFILINSFVSPQTASGQNAQSSSSTQEGIPFKPQGQLVFLQDGTGKLIKMITIQIADNEPERDQGLMWRYSMPEDDGMLFIFEKQQVLTFWMKNTYIPLDMIFANKSMKIVSIYRNATPLDETTIPSDQEALYCIEVNGGFCDKYGIKVGDSVEFER